MTKKQLARWISILACVAVSTLLRAAAGPDYDADRTNFGYVAGPAKNQAKLSSGGAMAYVPWFDTDNYYGDLLAAPITASGDVDIETTTWRAGTVMADAETAAPETYWDTGRFIVTQNLSGATVPFRSDTIDDDQLKSLGKEKEKVLDFIRGNRTEEGGKFDRVRTSLLGTFIHSNPVYVGRPDKAYPFGGYLAYAAANASRPGRVYIGGNDGMLHAFDAETGAETFAYIPSILMSKLGTLTEKPYAHRYFVDGPLTTADVHYNGAWHTVLVGTLGHGGQGIFALDVTSAAAITSEDNSASGAGSRVLWELDHQDIEGLKLGYTHGKVAIGRMANGRWMAVAGNGYSSSGGWASLLFIDIETGQVVREITVPDADGNGMSAPTLVDYDNDAIIDYAYAGDVKGSLWRFDLKSPNPGSWVVGNGGVSLFQTEGGLSITTAPEVGLHPERGFLVYIATGRLLSDADGADGTDNIVYGIWDNDWPVGEVPVDVLNLVTQTLTAGNHVPTETLVRLASNEAVNWATARGWRVPLTVDGDTTTGWRVVTPITLRSGRLHLLVQSPIGKVGRNWYLQLDALTGGAPRSTIVDVNRDGSLNVADNVDGNGDTLVEDVPEDRIVGVYKSVGLASAPMLSRLDTYNDAGLFNHLAQISQIHEDVQGDGEDAGVLGGHFDLDVASQTYAFDDGATDRHTHEWDDKYDSTVVDFFDILGGDHRNVDDLTGEPGTNRTKPFLITVVNAHLSQAGVLEINGIGTPVVEHRQKIKRYLQNSLFAGERPPLYTLDPPTPPQYAKGVRQLTDLKLRFPKTAILAGGLVGTNTNCVRSNEPGMNYEYRNGALTVQLLDASLGPPAKFSFDAGSNTYRQPNGTFRIHKDGYAWPYDLGGHRIGDGMMYEVIAFWHWSGPCYVLDEAESGYPNRYDELVGREWVMVTDDDIGDGIGDSGDDESVDDQYGDEETSFSAVSTTIVSAIDRLGRLFWREIVPEE